MVFRCSYIFGKQTHIFAPPSLSIKTNYPKYRYDFRVPDFCLKILILLGSDPDFNNFFRVGSLHFRPFCKGTPQICTAYPVPDTPSSVCVLQCAALERSHINIKAHVIQMHQTHNKLNSPNTLTCPNSNYTHNHDCRFLTSY